MAGDVWLSSKIRWSANNSLYHWVLEFLLSSVNDRSAVESLEELRDVNIGLVNLEDFVPKVRHQMLELLRDNLVRDAFARLPSDMSDRHGFIEGLRELADLASAAAT
jgi:hypothetical protein